MFYLSCRLLQSCCNKNLFHCIAYETTSAIKYSICLIVAFIVYYYLPHSYSIQHGTGNKIGLRLSVCVSSLSRSHFFVNFNQIGHRGVNPQK